MELTEALGALLTDAQLRTRLGEDPQGLAEALGLAGQDRAALLALDRGGLEAQARTLLSKRLHEVRQLLPRTFAALGPAGNERFLAYAGTCWPTGHQRHLDDALAFAQRLVDEGQPGSCRAELNRLRFLRQGRRWTCHLVPDARARGRARPGLQLLYRRGERVVERALTLGW